MKNIIRGTLASLVLLSSCANGNFQMSSELESTLEVKSIIRDEVVSICSSNGQFEDAEEGFMIIAWKATSDLNADKDLQKDPVKLLANDLSEKLELLTKAKVDDANYMLVRLSENEAFWLKY